MQKLELLILGVELGSETSWLYLDGNSNTILGLPWGIDSSKSFQYTLVATDSMNKTASLKLDILVLQNGLDYPEPTNLFTLTLEGVYSKFVNNIKDQIRLYDQLNKVFGKAGKPAIVVKSITQGSIVVSFHVYETETSPKPEVDCGKVQAHVDSVFDSEGDVKNSFTEVVSGYAVKEVSFAPKGACADALEPVKGKVRSPVTDENTDKDDSTPYAIIIGVVIAVIVLIIIIVVVVVLRRRKRANHDTSKANGTYIETGVPVVFDEDIKTMDQAEPAATDPLLEGATPQPPAYPQNGNAEASPLNPAKTDEPEQRYPTPPVSEHDDTDR